LENIIFIGSARDYHAIDWYRTVKEVCSSKRVVFVTDLIDGEGFEKLVNEDDCVIELFNIDWLLFRNQTKYGNMWRNFIKLVFFPLQAMRLKAIAKNNPNSVFHAIPMYYMFLCYIGGIRYIGTPQGSEILVRPNRSKLYKYLAVKSLLAAQHITVDSASMQNKILQLCGKESTVIQNGIDVAAILRAIENSCKREKVVSIRGFTSLYRINEIFNGRERSLQKPRLHLIYPFWEDVYRVAVTKRFEQGDLDLGRLSRTRMYELLASTKLAISIPISDSSPRGVYEAIFCGCCVAVTYNPWIDALPDCMKARLFIVDIEDNLWFERALEYADSITKVPYIPSEAALEMFDQRKSMQIVADKFY
jgi:hypothetical protein